MQSQDCTLLYSASCGKNETKKYQAHKVLRQKQNSKFIWSNHQLTAVLLKASPSSLWQVCTAHVNAQRPPQRSHRRPSTTHRDHVKITQKSIHTHRSHSDLQAHTFANKSSMPELEICHMPGSSVTAQVTEYYRTVAWAGFGDWAS